MPHEHLGNPTLSWYRGLDTIRSPARRHSADIKIYQSAASGSDDLAICGVIRSSRLCLISFTSIELWSNMNDK